jgi:hypothetical protein
MDIGMYLLLARFILSPEISPNTWSMLWIILMLVTWAGVKMVVSFANCILVVWQVKIEMIRSLAIRMISCMVYVTRMNSSGDSGLPCRSPHG